MRDNGGKTEYTKSSDGYGRRFPKRGLSLSLVRKKVRHTLCEGRYVDFDMKNAHPEILCQLLKTNRSCAKQLFVSLINHGRKRVYLRKNYLGLGENQ